MTVNKVRSVGIIGGGPSGAVSLDALIREGVFEKIVLFERKDNFGGTWRADKPKELINVIPGANEKDIDPPVEIPDELETQSEYRDLKGKRGPRWEESPATYRSLRTNVPERIMTFSDNKKFPYLDKPDQDELTTRESVENYIINYIDNLSHHNSEIVDIYKNTHVERILKKDDQWEVVYRTEQLDGSDVWKKLYFDSIIVATGHYNVPQIPQVQGIDKFINLSKGKVIHSKGLIVDEKFQDKKIIVVGSRSSASDTVRELRCFTQDLTWSVKETSTVFFAGHKLDQKPKTERKPPILKYQVENDETIVVFEDGSIIKNPDYVIYATGYYFSYPFLQEFNPDLTLQGKVVSGLYQHTFYIQDPSLIFVGTPIDGMSFRVFEYQAILVARYLANKFTLPPVSEQLEWHRERLEQYGVTRLFHTTGHDPALAYLELLTQLGGGYDPIGGSGKAFPEFSEKDLEVYEANKKRLTEGWSLL